MSGTTIRKALKTAEPEEFENIMGFYDPLVYDMIKSKLSPEEQLQEVSQIPLGIFLRLIEETLNEVDPVGMFGPAIAAVPEVAYKYTGTEDQEDDEEEELEEISAMGGGAVEGGAGKRDDEEAGLIREIEDYLFKSMGVTSE